MAIKVKVEKSSDSRYWGSTQNIPGVVVSDGYTIEELKENLKDAVELYLETAEENDQKTYNNFKEGFEFEYDFDISDIFNTFEVLNKTEFAKKIGINPSLFRKYTSDKQTYISEKRAKDIEAGLHQLGRELLAIKL